MSPRPRPHDIHVGIAEIAAVTNVKRKTAVQWGQRRILPPSCGCTVSRDRAWRLDDILTWAPNARPARQIRDDVIERLRAGKDLGDLIAEIEARPA